MGAQLINKPMNHHHRLSPWLDLLLAGALCGALDQELASGFVTHLQTAPRGLAKKQWIGQETHGRGEWGDPQRTSGSWRKIMGDCLYLRTRRGNPSKLAPITSAFQYFRQSSPGFSELNSASL